VDTLRRNALIIAGLMVASSVFAVAISPEPQEEVKPASIGLASMIPAQFGEWRVDDSVTPVLPAPDVEAKVKQIYDETVARTYIDKEGRRVMLSIAYGGDQTGRLRVHRPESCYSAQGFLVRQVAEQQLALASRTVPVKRLLATQGARQEPITYWIRVGDEAVAGWMGQRMVQLKYGLTGEVPDGLIFRVSSLGHNFKQEFDLQDRFLRDLVGSLSAADTTRLVGASTAKPQS
jgi:EpsI family protein